MGEGTPGASSLPNDINRGFFHCFPFYLPCHVDNFNQCLAFVILKLVRTSILISAPYFNRAAEVLPRLFCAQTGRRQSVKFL
jgi:hypothetical protein